MRDEELIRKAMIDFNRDRTVENMVTLLELLKNAVIWIPCNAVISQQDEDAIMKMLEEKGQNIAGSEWENRDQIRMIPDILQNGDRYYFPVFTSEEEMGEYGNHFSKLPTSFMHAVILARNNERNVEGIVINAFTEPFILGRELFDVIESMNLKKINNTRRI